MFKASPLRFSAGGQLPESGGEMKVESLTLDMQAYQHFLTGIRFTLFYLCWGEVSDGKVKLFSFGVFPEFGGDAFEYVERTDVSFYRIYFHVSSTNL